MKAVKESVVATSAITMFISMGCTSDPTEELSGSNESGDEQQEQILPNLLFIYAYQWRRMALGHYCDSKYDGGYNQGDPVQTPNLDKLITKGVLFNNSICTSPMSSPNRATIMTGLYPQTHCLLDNTVTADFDLSQTTIAHRLSAAGYDTAHLGKWDMESVQLKNVLDDEREKRGFDYWYTSSGHQHFDMTYYFIGSEIDGLGEYVANGTTTPMPFLPSEAYGDDDLCKQECWECDHLTRKSLDYLKNSYGRRDTQKPFALYISYSPPHTISGPKPVEDSSTLSYTIDGTSGEEYGANDIHEYRAPLDYESKYGALSEALRPNASLTHYSHVDSYKGYFGAITSIDERIGEIVDYLESTPDPRYSGKTLKETTIIVFTADHGEMMGSHDRMTKGVEYEESISVPLIISWEGHITPREEEAVMSSVNLAPSILGLMGQSFATKVDGVDFGDAILNGGSVGEEYGYISLRRWRAIRSNRGIIVSDCTTDFILRSLDYYNLEDDPFQLNPIDLYNKSGDLRNYIESLSLSDETEIKLHLDKLEIYLKQYDSEYDLLGKL